MTQEEYEERMENTKYQDLEVTNAQDKKPYVFISYRSSSWEKVLTEIVYTLQKRCGLRIYFDKDFASKKNVWIDQFIDNMDTYKCRAVLCFMDEGYYTSYATLLELMCAKNCEKEIVPVNFPVDFTALKKREGDTGLGNSTGNPASSREYDEFCDQVGYIIAMYKDKPEEIAIKKCFNPIRRRAWDKNMPILKECKCASLMQAIGPENLHPYSDKPSYLLQHILTPLLKIDDEAKEEDGENFISIFEDPELVRKAIYVDKKLPGDPNTDTSEGTTSPAQKQDENDNVGKDDKVDDGVKSKQSKNDKKDTDKVSVTLPSKMSFDEFVKKYNAKTFTGKSFKYIGIEGPNADLSMDIIYDSTFKLVWDFIMKCLEKDNEYIYKTIEKEKNMDRPAFIDENKFNSLSDKDQKKYIQVECEKLSNYYMYRNLDQYGWMTFAKKRIEDFGLNKDVFSIRFSDTKDVEQQTANDTKTLDDKPVISPDKKETEVNRVNGPNSLVY